MSVPDAAQMILETVPVVNRFLRLLASRRALGVVSVPQYRVLVHLKDEGPQSLKDLAEKEGVTPPTMSAFVDALVTKAFLLRNESTQDRRKLILSVTEKGEKFVDSVRGSILESLRSELKSWSPENLELIKEAMKVLRTSTLIPSKRQEVSL